MEYTLEQEIQIAKGNLKGLYYYGDTGEATEYWIRRLKLLKELQELEKHYRLSQSPSEEH